LAFNAFNNNDPNVHRLYRTDFQSPPEPLTDDSKIWVGMPSVSPSTRRGNPIAFAGMIPNSGGYDENNNQIWGIQPATGSFHQLAPLQGRSPWWSPDGSSIVFESNRLSGGTQSYRIFLESGGGGPAVALTPPGLGVQHAKFSPDGSRLVIAVNLPGG